MMLLTRYVLNINVADSSADKVIEFGLQRRAGTADVTQARRVMALARFKVVL